MIYNYSFTIFTVGEKSIAERFGRSVFSDLIAPKLINPIVTIGYIKKVNILKNNLIYANFITVE